MKTPKQITITCHYLTDDPECSGDYASVTIEFDGKVVKEYGDYYHDKGDLCADAFVEGYRLIDPKAPRPNSANKADREC